MSWEQTQRLQRWFYMSFWLKLLYQSCLLVNIIYVRLHVRTSMTMKLQRRNSGFRQMSLPSLTCYDHKPPSGGINRIFGCSFYTWHSCIPPQNHTFLHALRLSTKISGPQWILSLLSGKKLFQAWGLVLGPYLVFTDANLSFHVYSWEVSYLADNPVTKLPPCA